MYAADSRAPATETPMTLNDRLNKMLEGFGYHCDRLERVLGQVNGTPQKIESARVIGTAPRPTLSMATAVEHLEQTMVRLGELTASAERIA